MSILEAEVKGQRTYVLVTCICKDNDRKTAQNGDYASRLDHSNISNILLGVPFDEMGDD